MTLKPILDLLEDADRRMTEAHKLAPDGSIGRLKIGGVMAPLFDCIQDLKQLQAEIEREERRKYHP